MTSSEIRQKFLKFFEKNGHAIVPSSSLIPDDPSVLLTTAGMQRFKPYYTGDADPLKDFGSLNTISVQKCFRTSDIDEVGDESHLTFFEMLGNFSFGGYFKEKAIEYAYEFITKELGLKIDYVSVFEGDSRFKLGQKVPKDIESEKIWRSLGVTNIKYSGREDNFWGPTGNKGPCGPTTEIYVNGVEIWNIVFNEYYGEEQDTSWLVANWNKWAAGRGHRNLKLAKLGKPGVDTGMGLERLTMVVQKKKTIFETDLLYPIILKIRELTPIFDERVERIIADHIRGSVFLIGDGLDPSNKGTGYILRRHLRRILAYFMKYDVHKDPLPELVNLISKEYGGAYPELVDTRRILSIFGNEKQKFNEAIENNKSSLEKIKEDLKKEGKEELVAQEVKRGEKYKLQDPFVPGSLLFSIYSTYGIPIEVLEVLLDGFVLDKEGFEKEFAKHQEISRAGSEKKFGGHGLILDTGELKAGSEEELKKVTRLHTATHLLQKALREVLGDEVQQRGSDITTERTRFDFSFPRKMTPEEIKRVEEIVNEKIKEDLPVSFKEMAKGEAEKTGALYFFKAKYPEKVKVYYVGKTIENAWSKEFCGGPHVTHTGEIGKFKITKEEPVAAGIRRIRATVE